MNFTIEPDMSFREPFGEYRYAIRRDGQIVAYYWHDYRGDEHGIDFVDGMTVLGPLGRVPDFMVGGGPRPLALTGDAVEFLAGRCK